MTRSLITPAPVGGTKAMPDSVTQCLKMYIFQLSLSRMPCTIIAVCGNIISTALLCNFKHSTILKGCGIKFAFILFFWLANAFPQKHKYTTLDSRVSILKSYLQQALRTLPPHLKLRLCLRGYITSFS